MANASLPHSLQHWKQMLCRKDLGHRGLLCLPSFPQEQFSWKLIWNWETGEDMELEINWKGFETGLAVPSRPLASAHKPSPAICRYLETYLEKTTCFLLFFFHSIMRKYFNHTCGMLLRDQLDRSPDEGPRMFSLTFRCVSWPKKRFRNIILSQESRIFSLTFNCVVTEKEVHGSEKYYFWQHAVVLA